MKKPLSLGILSQLIVKVRQIVKRKHAHWDDQALASAPEFPALVDRAAWPRRTSQFVVKVGQIVEGKHHIGMIRL